MESPLTQPRPVASLVEIGTLALLALKDRANLRQEIASGATGIGLALAATSFKTDWQMTVAILLVMAGTFTNARRPAVPALAAFVLIVASAIATTVFVPNNIGGLVLMVPFALLVFNGNKFDRVMFWMLPFAFAHAAVMFWQAGFSDQVIRVTGLTNNANLAAGFLAVSATYLLASRAKWMALPLLAAMTLSGSRLAAVVMLVVIVGIAIQQRGYRHLLIIPGAALLLFPLWGNVLHGYRLSDNIFASIMLRLDDPWFPGLIGRGWTEAIAVLNIPVRVALEWGLLAGAAWAAISIYALWCRPRFNAAWWMMVAMVGLAMLDHYLWLPVLVGFWWMLISARPPDIPNPIKSQAAEKRKSFAAPQNRCANSNSWVPVQPVKWSPEAASIRLIPNRYIEFATLFFPCMIIPLSCVGGPVHAAQLPHERIYLTLASPPPRIFTGPALAVGQDAPRLAGRRGF